MGSMQEVQNFARDVLARLGVMDNDPLASYKHVAQISERHVGRGLRIVEPTTAISFDENSLAHAAEHAQ